MLLPTWLVTAALAATQPLTVNVGESALQFSLPALNEQIAFDLVHRPQVGLSDFTGVTPPRPAKAVVVHFFNREHGATALADLNHLQKHLGTKGVQVLAISTDQDDIGTLSTWVQDLKLDFPVLRDNHGVVVKRYGITELPLTMVVDSNGHIFAIGQPQGDNIEHTLEGEVSPLLNQ